LGNKKVLANPLKQQCTGGNCKTLYVAPLPCIFGHKRPHGGDNIEMAHSFGLYITGSLYFSCLKYKVMPKTGIRQNGRTGGMAKYGN
jgi:hypothetical protein